MSRNTTLFGSPESRRQRHDRMVELRARGWTYQQIAEAIGLWDGHTISYHLREKCSCGLRRNGAREALTPEGKPDA